MLSKQKNSSTSSRYAATPPSFDRSHHQAYLPDAFESERSSIQGLLRFKRLSLKSRILRTFLGEQHIASADPKSKPSSFDANHAIARTLVMEQLVHIQSVTATFAEYFSKCDAKEFEGASAIFHELDPVERNLDHWLTNLRVGEMNEHACSDSLRGYNPGLDIQLIVDRLRCWSILWRFSSRIHSELFRGRSGVL